MMFINSYSNAWFHIGMQKFKDLLKGIIRNLSHLKRHGQAHINKKLSSIKLTCTKGIREHITKMRDIVAQVKSLKIEVSETFLVHSIMNSHPAQDAPLRYPIIPIRESGQLIDFYACVSGRRKDGFKNLQMWWPMRKG